MSYIRWSSRVKDECTTCGSSGYTLGKLCKDCTSCWYIFDTGNFDLAVWHRGCAGGCEDNISSISYEDAAVWHAPTECPWAAIAESRVTEAVKYWQEETAESQNHDFPAHKDV